VTSSTPVPRDAQGNPLPAPHPALFGRMSGTSMATPAVAGAAALYIQQAGGAVTSAQVRKYLLDHGVVALAHPVNVAGAGRLGLTGL